MEEDFLKVKDKFEIDFDDVIVYPGPQPRESGDVELLKNKKVVAKISVKTAVSGDVKVAFRKIWQDIKNGQNGMILAVYTCREKNSDKELLKLIMIYLPNIVKKYDPMDVYSEFRYLMQRKAERENCDIFRLLAINDAIQFEYLRKTMQAELVAEKASQMAEKAYKESRKTRELLEELLDYIKKKS